MNNQEKLIYITEQIATIRKDIEYYQKSLENKKQDLELYTLQLELLHEKSMN